MEESRRQVQERLRTTVGHGVDHGDILASLQHEIDKHNAVKDDLRQTMRPYRRHVDQLEHASSPSSIKFRFKSGTSDPRKRTHHSREHGHRKKQRLHEQNDSSLPSANETAHPFPREPTDADHTHLNATDAFRESLFDALADDEGAQYWEGVYSQPLHVYSRPSIVTEKGELEQMGDEEYAAHVKTKMWERKNPHIVRERQRAERDRKEAEEEQTKRREAFVRRKEHRAWERAQSGGRARQAGDEEAEKVFSRHTNSNTSHGRDMEKKEYAVAWSTYLTAWEQLKHELLSSSTARNTDPTASASRRIPWPVLPSKLVVRPNIEAFMREASSSGADQLRVLKQERVKWHPDKMQQRFAGRVDEGTMKLVTGIFQVVDGMVEEEREKG